MEGATADSPWPSLAWLVMDPQDKRSGNEANRLHSVPGVCFHFLGFGVLVRSRDVDVKPPIPQSTITLQHQTTSAHPTMIPSSTVDKQKTRSWGNTTFTKIGLA